MAEVYLWAALTGFCAVGYGMSKKLGLLDAVPRDPHARVAAYCSSVLGVVKDQLIGSELVDWQPHQVNYLKRAKPATIDFQDGAVHWRHGGGEEVFPLGDLGGLTFALEGDQMSVTIVAAETGLAERTAQVSVRMLAVPA